MVDDNPFNIETLSLMINSLYGIKVIKAYNGEEAVSIFKERNVQKNGGCGETCKFKFIELIFMDLNMPVLDGVKATDQIFKLQEAEEGTVKTSIVALTAYQNKETLDKCLKLGMSQILHKPARSSDLKQVICKACPLLKRNDLS